MIFALKLKSYKIPFCPPLEKGEDLVPPFLKGVLEGIYGGDMVSTGIAEAVVAYRGSCRPR